MIDNDEITVIMMSQEYNSLKLSLSSLIYKKIVEKRQKKVVNLIQENEKEFLTVLYEPYSPSYPGEFIETLLPPGTYRKRYVSNFILHYNPKDDNDFFAVAAETGFHFFCSHVTVYPYDKLKKLSFFKQLKLILRFYGDLEKNANRVLDYVHEKMNRYPIFEDFIARNTCFIPFLKGNYDHVTPMKQLTPSRILVTLNQLRFLDD
jgi:hypothetical protein